MKQAPWILFCISICAVIYLMTCNKPAPSDAVPRSQFKAMEQRLNDTAQAYTAFRKASDSVLNAAMNLAWQLGVQSDRSRSALNESKQTIQWLLSQLDSADKEKPVANWVQVSDRYKDGCDSLRKENVKIITRIDQAGKDNQMQVDAMGNEIKLRDSLLERERQFNAQFQQSLADCIAIGKRQQELSKPRIQLYGGIGAWGNQLHPFGGGEINLSLKTPQDQIYEIKGAYIYNTLWVGAGTKFKLHF